MTSKYIIVKEVLDGFNVLDNVPIVFPEVLNHAQVAAKFGCVDTSMSAGFCYMKDDGWEDEIRGTSYSYNFYCYGESVSLKLESRGATNRVP